MKKFCKYCARDLSFGAKYLDHYCNIYCFNVYNKYKDKKCKLQFGMMEHIEHQNQLRKENLKNLNTTESISSAKMNNGELSIKFQKNSENQRVKDASSTERKILKSSGQEKINTEKLNMEKIKMNTTESSENSTPGINQLMPESKMNGEKEENHQLDCLRPLDILAKEKLHSMSLIDDSASLLFGLMKSLAKDQLNNFNDHSANPLLAIKAASELRNTLKLKLDLAKEIREWKQL